MFKVADFMSHVVVTATPETPIFDAIRLLAARNLSGLPIMNEDLRLVGFLSEKDVLHLLKESEEKRGSVVSDFMSENVVHFDIGSNLVDLCDCLEERHFRSAPITDEERIVGIVRRSDVIKAILACKHQAAPALPA